MILALLAAATVVGEVPPAPGLVAPCIWTNLPAYRLQVIAAPDLKTFKTLRNAYPPAEAEAAFTACAAENGDDAAAELAFNYYEASLWARKRLVGKWPEAKLNALDAIPETDLQYFWIQPAPEKTPLGWTEARKAAWARVYGAFGRQGPAEPTDDLDAYIFARVGWRLGEMDYRQRLARR